MIIKRCGENGLERGMVLEGNQSVHGRQRIY